MVAFQMPKPAQVLEEMLEATEELDTEATEELDTEEALLTEEELLLPGV